MLVFEISYLGIQAQEGKEGKTEGNDRSSELYLGILEVFGGRKVENER